MTPREIHAAIDAVRAAKHANPCLLLVRLSVIDRWVRALPRGADKRSLDTRHQRAFELIFARSTEEQRRPWARRYPLRDTGGGPAAIIELAAYRGRRERRAAR